MKKIIFLVAILLIPVCAGAAYTIYLKNGSVISDARSYSETGEEISIFFQTGAMVIPRSDILRITGEETPEKAVPEATQETEDEQVPGGNSERRSPEDQPAARERQKQPVSSPAPAEPGGDGKARIDEARADLDSVYSEIREVEKDEARLVKEINEKRSKPVYNKYQANQLMRETEPLQQELSGVQQKKEELRQRKTALEDELRAVQ